MEDSLYSGRNKLLISHSKTGFRPSLITADQELILKEKLNNPLNGMVGFIELLDWFNNTFKTDINYKTFHGFVVRKYKAKIKTARKSHIKKDAQAVETFKKTSSRSVKTLSMKKRKVTKK
jgi:hypothetical protein